MGISDNLGTIIFGMILLHTFVVNEGMLSEGTYRIENLNDGLHLTTEGGNSSFAKVVAENWQNFGEQKWQIKKFGRGGYHLVPVKHRTNNPLSFYRDPSRKYPTPESWILIPARDGYQIQNTRTSGCLISAGRRKDVTESKCDKHVRVQQWQFHSI